MYSQVIINRLVLILSIIVFTGSKGFGQNTGESLRTVLISLEERLDISFTYADETIENIQLIPPADSLSIDDALTYLRTNTSLNFHQLDNRFITISRESSSTINICAT